MPEYLELLKMAELDKVFGSQFVQLLKNSGAVPFLSLLLLSVTVMLLGRALVTRSRATFGAAAILAPVGAILGWLASYAGYLRACAVVNAAHSLPKEAELVEGANAMAWSALVPTLVAAPIILLAALGLVFLKGRPTESGP